MHLKEKVGLLQSDLSVLMQCHDRGHQQPLLCISQLLCQYSGHYGLSSAMQQEFWFLYEAIHLQHLHMKPTQMHIRSSTEFSTAVNSDRESVHLGMTVHLLPVCV